MGLRSIADRGKKTRWPRQLKRAVRYTAPIPMTVEIDVDEDSSGTTYYAVLGDTAGETGGTPEWRAQIWLHPPGVGEDVGRRLECSVYFHPESRRPVAIEYARGVLWVIAGSGAVKRLLNG